MFFQAAPVYVKDDDDDINNVLFAFDNSFQRATPRVTFS